MSTSDDMPAAMGLLLTNSIPLAEMPTSRNSIPKRKRELSNTRLLVVIFVVFFLTFAGNMSFLIYLNCKLNEQISYHRHQLNETMNKISEFESQVQGLRKQMEKYVNKNTSKPLQLVGEEARYQSTSVADVEEYPFIQDIEESHLIKVNGSVSSMEKMQSRRNSSSPPLIGEEIKPSEREPLPLIPDSGESDSSEETEPEEGSKEYGTSMEVFVGKPPQNRRKRNAELADESGGGNLIDGHEQFDKRNKSSKAEFVKSTLQQNFTISPTNTENRRSSPIKKTPITQAYLAQEEVGETDDITMEKRKTVIAAHFGADSSKYSPRTHSNYDGNHHLRHPTGEYEDWKPSQWFSELNMDKHFALTSGNIKVHTPGLYFVYAQIFYSDLNDMNGYFVYLNSQIVLQCTTTTISLTKNATTKSNTCFTGGVVRCQHGDKISIKTADANRKVMLEATRSFVGMFKIGEFQSV